MSHRIKWTHQSLQNYDVGEFGEYRFTIALPYRDTVFTLKVFLGSEQEPLKVYRLKTNSKYRARAAAEWVVENKILKRQ